jgi:hypothetical protein
MDLDRWVNDSNPDEQLQYSKGRWDQIELIRLLIYKFGAKEAQVVATYPITYQLVRGVPVNANPTRTRKPHVSIILSRLKFTR